MPAAPGRRWMPISRHRPHHSQDGPPPPDRLRADPQAAGPDHRRVEPPGARPAVFSRRRPAHPPLNGAAGCRSGTSPASSSPTCTWMGWIISARKCCARRAICATLTTSRCSTTMPGSLWHGGSASGSTLPAGGSGCIRARRYFFQPGNPPRFSASSCCRMGSAGSPRRTCAGSGIGYAACATVGGREPSRKKTSSGGSAPGLRTPNMRTRGGSASRSFAADGFIWCESLTTSHPRFARRLLEQRTEEPPVREPQQEHHRKPEQRRRIPCCPHARMPEPAALRGRRARDERPGVVMMRTGRSPLLPRSAGEGRPSTRR